MKKLNHILKSKIIFKVLLLLSIVYLIFITKLIVYKSSYNHTDKKFIVRIEELKRDSDKLSLLVKGKEKIKAIYYFHNKNKYFDLKLGDVVEITGDLTVPSNNTVPNIFNYKEYLYNKKIYYILKIKNIKKIENNTNIIYFLKNKINDRIDKIANSKDYILTFILGDKRLLDDDIYNSYKDNGISHLFSISGMHINLLTFLLLIVLKKISYNNLYNYSIIITFLIIYAFILGMMASVFRTLIMYIIFTINKLFNLKIKAIDLMILVFAICIFINPFIFYDISFQYSYIISFTLILIKDKIKNIKGYFKKSVYISYVSFLVSFPITVYNFYQCNIISIFLNVLVIPFVSIIIFPLTILTFIFPFLDYFLMFFINILEFISLNISKIEFTKIILSKPSIYMLCIYYIIIYVSLYKKKYIFMLMLIVFIHKNIVYLNPYLNILYLDVGQGDSILIRFPHSKNTILIDTGGIINSEYSVTKNKTIPYLKSLGITQLNYVIISHGDYDHMGDLSNLAINFKINNVIFNNDKFNNLELKLIKILKTKKIKYYQNIESLNIDGNKLYFLNTKNYDNENDNSNVIYFKYNNFKMVFMGDAGVKKEKDILEKYNLKDIDVLKIGHHGSNTSSSKEFIQRLNPKYSIISVGKNNFYGHPDIKVINRLKKSKIYRTDLDGSVSIKVKQNDYTISTYPA